MLPPNCALMPVLKADAYGHGAVWIGRKLNALGLRSFCVATAAEGAALRKGGVEGEILVLGYTPPEQFGLLCRSRLMQTVTDSGYAKQLAGYGKRLEVQIAVDTGMRRLGVRCEQVEEIVWIFSSKRLNVKSVKRPLTGAAIAGTATEKWRAGISPSRRRRFSPLWRASRKNTAPGSVLR